MTLEPLISYGTSIASVDLINSEITRILDAANTDDALRPKFEAIGVDPGVIGNAEEPMLRATPRGSGVEPVSTGIAIVFATRFAYRVATDVWAQIVLPELLKRFGEGALQDQQPAPKRAKRTKKR